MSVCCIVGVRCSKVDANINANVGYRLLISVPPPNVHRPPSTAHRQSGRLITSAPPLHRLSLGDRVFIPTTILTTVPTIIPTIIPTIDLRETNPTFHCGIIIAAYIEYKIIHCPPHHPFLLITRRHNLANAFEIIVRSSHHECRCRFSTSLPLSR